MFTVGDILPEHKTGKDSLAIGVTEEVIAVYIGYKNPSKQEVEDFKNNKLELRLIKKGTAIIFSFKLDREEGDHYFDLFYNPNMSPSISHYRFEEVGYAMMFVVLDSDTGQILGLRCNFLPVEISNLLVGMILEEEATREKFKKLYYELNVANIMSNWRSVDLFESHPDNSVVLTSGISADNVIFAGDLM